MTGRGVGRTGAPNTGEKPQTAKQVAALCQVPEREPNWWDRLRDDLGFDGHFGRDGTSGDAFTWRGFTRAIENYFDDTRASVSWEWNGDEQELVIWGEPRRREGVSTYTPQDIYRGAVNGVLSIDDVINTSNHIAQSWIGWGIEHPRQAAYLTGQQAQRGAQWAYEHPVEVWSAFGYAVAWEAAAPEILGGVLAGLGGRSAIDDVAGVARLRPRGTVVAPEAAIGRIAPSGLHRPGFTNFGREMEDGLPALLRELYPETQFRLRTGPGRTGPDVEYLSGPHPGFDFLELSRGSARGADKFLEQVSRWQDNPAYGPRVYQSLFYDDMGYIYRNFDDIPEGAVARNP